MVGAMGLWVYRQWQRQSQEGADASRRPSARSDRPDAESSGIVDRIYALAGPLNTFVENSAHPQDLLASATFMQGVDLFTSDDLTAEQVGGYATGDNTAIACMALEALSKRAQRLSSVSMHLN